MYTKTDLAALLRRYGLHLRALGKHAVIPFLAVDLLLPVLTALCLYQSQNPAEDMLEVLSYLLIILPLFSFFIVKVVSKLKPFISCP